jgi:hypothetical protein
MSDVLDWAEKAGNENIKFRLQNSEALAKESAVMLTILITGLGGALALAMRYTETATASEPIAAGAAAVSVWFMISAVTLVHQCIRTFDLPAPTNEPINLYQPAFTLIQLREVELQNLQHRIEDVTRRNGRVARWLDRVRYWSVATPLVFIIVASAVAYS